MFVRIMLSSRFVKEHGCSFERRVERDMPRHGVFSLIEEIIQCFGVMPISENVDRMDEDFLVLDCGTR